MQHRGDVGGGAELALRERLDQQQAGVPAEQLESTAGQLAKVTDKWNGQLAALAQLAGSAPAAADLSGLSKSDIEAAVKASDKTAVDAAVEAAKPTTRRPRPPAGTSAPALSKPGPQADSAGAT